MIGISVSSTIRVNSSSFLFPPPKWTLMIPAFPDNMPPTRASAYTISKDGKIAITFNNDFVIDGEGFAGQIQFQGTVSCDLDKDETKNIVIGNNTGTITIKPENIKTDISLEKS